MSILICGSMAYDIVMVLNDKLKLGHDVQTEKPLSLYFSVPDLHRYFGGCAGNIAYNLKLLGLEKAALPMAAVGADFAPYANWLKQCRISQEYIKIIEHNYTAQTVVTLDTNDNKITAFHPGAMDFSHFNRAPGNKDIHLGVIAPDGPEGMRLHACQLVDAGTPILFYPGISIRQMDGNELLAFIHQARWVTVNEDELAYVQKLTGLSEPQIIERVETLIVNRHEEGVFIYTGEIRHDIPGYRPKVFRDPTGGEDAFCAGLLYGLNADIDWETTGRIATLMWAIKVEHHGSQTHAFTLQTFKALYKKIFGYALIS